MCINHIFFVNSVVSRHLHCFHFLAIVSRASDVFNIPISLLLDMYPLVGFLYHMVVSFLIFFEESPYYFPYGCTNLQSH
jgi:hypothetical protein